MAVSKVTVPAELYRTAWVMAWQYLNYSFTLPPNKDLGFTRIQWDIDRDNQDNTINHVFARGMTHLQAVYGGFNNRTPGREWRNVRGSGEILIVPFVNHVIGNGVTWTQEFTVTNIDNNDFILGEHYFVSGSLQGCSIGAEYVSTNKVRVRLINSTGSSKTISGNYRVGIVMSPDKIANSEPLHMKRIVISQVKEDSATWAQSEQTDQKMYARYVSNLGVTNPNQVPLYGDYFQAVEGASVGEYWNTTRARRKAQLASESNARKIYAHQPEPVSGYYSRELWKHRGRLVEGYMDSYVYVRNGNFLHRQIFSIEKAHIGKADARTASMGWQRMEGIFSTLTTHGVYYRLKQTEGDILLKTRASLSFESVKCQGIITLLLSSSFFLWHENSPMVKNPKAIPYNHDTRFQPTAGGSIVNYVPGTSGQPAFESDAKGRLPEAPQTGDAGAYVAGYMYAKISSESDRVSISIRYAKFTYKVNGGSAQNGYSGGATPVNGSLGNAEVSRMNVANPGQDNIVDSEADKKPIVWVTQGTAGLGFFIKNVNCDPRDSIEYLIDVSGTIYSVTHRGRSGILGKLN